MKARIAQVISLQSLTVRAALDRGTYPTRKKVTDEELAEVHLRHAAFHGDWNYIITPM